MKPFGFIGDEVELKKSYLIRRAEYLFIFKSRPADSSCL